MHYFNGSPKEQLACLNRAVEYVQLTEDLETRFMAAVKRMKQAFNLCSSSDAISDRENRRRDEAFANEVLDDVAEQLAKLLEELKKEKDVLYV